MINFKNSNFILLFFFLLLSIIFTILLFKYNYKKENFTNINKMKEINLDKLRLQIMVNNFENKRGCCYGYKTLSNNCKFNFDSNINNCCY